MLGRAAAAALTHSSNVEKGFTVECSGGGIIKLSAIAIHFPECAAKSLSRQNRKSAVLMPSKCCAAASATGGAGRVG
ncbi:MAG: hypothetical protein HYR85_10460 [Planctomycetes bacterium]|nr:hypothetical protein [Planctomycetota bacterium]